MRKLILLYFAFLLLPSCNRVASDEPDNTTTNINDPASQILLQSFDEHPQSKSVTVVVEPKEVQTARTQHADITGLIDRLKSPAQHFTIDVSSAASITGEKGTTILFNTACFIDKKGNEVLAPIDVELKELYHVNEMAKENLPATSNNRLLHSKGAICITAFYKGEELKLKLGELINVNYPFALNEKENYQFFYGQKNNGQVINWMPAEDEVATAGVQHNSTMTAPQFSYKQLDLKTYLKEFIEYPEDARRNELSARVEIGFRIEKNGDITVTSAGSTYKTFKDEINRVLQAMPLWTPAQFNGQNIASSMKMIIDFNLRRKNQVRVETNENDVIVYVPIKNREHSFSIKDAHTRSIYSRSFGNMGWINCDKFIYDKSPKSDLIVRADAYTDVKVIIKNRNTVVNGDDYAGYSRFKNLPLNAEVFILSIRNENGNMSYSLQQVKLNKQNVITPVWKKTSEENLGLALNNLSTGV